MLEVKTKLKSIRKEKNYTQGFVAEKLGISLRAYSKIESGETQLTIERLNNIIAILEINPHQILGINPQQILETKNKEVIIHEGELNKHISEDSITLIEHYKETISILKEHIETLKRLLDKT